jgi:hypothetical protein
MKWMGSMSKSTFIILVVVMMTTACFSRGAERLMSEGFSQVVPTATAPGIQTLQIDSSSPLPPYGMNVKADVVSLKLQVSSSKNDATARFTEIQQAVEHITSLASESNVIRVEGISVSQISGRSSRDITESYSWNSESVSIIMNLSIDLEGQDDNLLDSIIEFNHFLKGIQLAETVSIQAVSLKSEIRNVEQYRPRLITKVYDELAQVQQQYGKTVKFEVTGLHGELQTIQLNDTEYYIYLEPNIIVREF